MSRYVDTSGLLKKSNRKRTCIDWEKSVGMEIPFQFDQVQGKLSLLEHQKGNYIVVGYGQRRKKLRTNQLLECKIHDLIYGDFKLLRSLDFSQVPKRNGKYDWLHSSGCWLPFCFNGTEGELFIKEYESLRGMGFLKIRYEGEDYWIRTMNLLNGKIAAIVGFGKYKYEKGREFKGEKKDITILDRKKESGSGPGGNITRKKYQYRCNRCGYIGWTEENALERSAVVCSHCAGKTAVRGKTDIATEAPWMVPFFQEKDRHLVYTCRKQSDIKIYPICSQCRRVRETAMSINTLYTNHSIACPRCSDSVSYPEKYVYEVFCQLGVPMIYHPGVEILPWCRPFQYDFYDRGKGVLVETNGMHHYKEVKHFGRSLEQVRISDDKKKKLAAEHGILPRNYLVLDCRYSRPDYIKESLLKDQALQAVYPFKEGDIDWEECERAHMKSFYWEIFCYKENHPGITEKEIADHFRIYRSTVVKALKKACYGMEKRMLP